MVDGITMYKIIFALFRVKVFFTAMPLRTLNKL